MLEFTADQGGGLELNGIDFVEVLDSAAPSPDLRQRVLVVVFLKPDGVGALGPDNFRVEGGSRIQGIRVSGLSPGADARTVELLLDRAGDFSTYRLRLIAGPGAGTPPAPFDAPLSQVDFRFKVECPSDFDCVQPPGPPAPPPEDDAPPVDYLTRDFAGHRRMMLDRMRAAMPDWRDDSPADLGVTLVEALAHAADRASWMQDAVGTEAYLATARLRTSLRRHARALGYRPDAGCTARTVLAVEAFE
ncbi:MAG: hypothetical protein ACOCY0_02185, partial [Roseicyclus sp.]